MPHIDYFFTPLSPYAYMASGRFEEIAARHGATVTYKPFDLIASFPRTGGQPVPQRHPSRQEYRLIEMPRQAKKYGIPFNTRPAHWPTNGAPSSYAIIAASKAGGGDLPALVTSFMRACWAEEKDIADDAVIKSCLEAAGFDPSLADSGLLAGAETYADNLEEAVSKGVFGAPFFIVDGVEKFWGQDRLEDLDLFLSGKL